jgi:putative radical SAM enzyme (TIGR03279 family)
MPKQTGQLIKSCLPGSIAEELGLAAGDRLLLIDGQKVRDVFDYRLRQMASDLLLTIEQRDGTLVEYDIEKDEDEDLGLEFEDGLLDECTHCHNHCVFCFIDQLPKGMRKTLYFKDDDLRLTFLTGNYVTLTNISDDELDRLISYRFSPMNISVHTTDPDLRLKMMKNPKSGQILERLQRIASAGIALNTQIVLCPDWNDKAALERTLQDLSALQPPVQSIAVVPVGVTRFRDENGLEKMRPFTLAECRDVIATVDRYQALFLETTGSRIFYAADEFYLRGGIPLPLADHYDDFPQLENGVGMASLFQATLADYLAGAQDIPAAEPLELAWPTPAASDQITASHPIVQLADCRPAIPTGRILVVTGTMAAPILEAAAATLSTKLNLAIEVVPVVNHFFGDTITVTGLLTGQDVRDQLRPHLDPTTCVLVPDCLLKADSPVLLDDITLADLSTQLGVPVFAVKADAEALVSSLDWIIAQRSVTP